MGTTVFAQTYSLFRFVVAGIAGDKQTEKIMVQNKKGRKERCFPDTIEAGKVCPVMNMNA